MPSPALLPSSGSNEAAVNLAHLKLFHHFQICTRQTLFFTPEVWGYALQLSFQFEFLMNSMLSLAARHLAFLHPEDAKYRTVAASHLCRALPLFSHALSNFTAIPIDAFLATSALLQYETWTSTDFVWPQGDGEVSFDPSRDQFFTLSSSLKEVFLKSLPLVPDQLSGSIFMPHISYNPINKLVESAQISNHTLIQHQEVFSCHRPLTLELLNFPCQYTRGTDLVTSNPWRHDVPKAQDVPDLIEDDYAPIIARICLILSFLPEARPPTPISAESPLFPEFTRCVLYFPMLCRGPFLLMVQQRDPHALLLLYHFYRAVRILLPPCDCWWAHERATVLETVLKEWLTRECAKQAQTWDPI